MANKLWGTWMVGMAVVAMIPFFVSGLSVESLDHVQASQVSGVLNG